MTRCGAPAGQQQPLLPGQRDQLGDVVGPRPVAGDLLETTRHLVRAAARSRRAAAAARSSPAGRSSGDGSADLAWFGADGTPHGRALGRTRGRSMCCTGRPQRRAGAPPSSRVLVVVTGPRGRRSRSPLPGPPGRATATRCSGTAGTGAPRRGSGQWRRPPVGRMSIDGRAASTRSSDPGYTADVARTRRVRCSSTRQASGVACQSQLGRSRRAAGARAATRTL